MATRIRCTPRSVGTGEEAEEEEGQFSERPSSSSSRPNKGEGVCLVCALGATLEQMQKAARGGRKGHHRLLLELALQRKDEEQKTEKEQARSRPSQREVVQTSSSSSTTSSSPRRKTEKRKRGQRELTHGKKKPQREEEKSALQVTATEKGKGNGNQLVTAAGADGTRRISRYGG